MWSSRPSFTAHGISLCHDHRRSRLPANWFSHPPKLDKSSTTKNSWGTDPDSLKGDIPLENALETWLWEDKVLSTNGLSTRFVTHVPQKRDDWDKGFKDKVCHIVTQLLYQHGSRVREGKQCFKDNVYHLWHPPTSPALLIVARLLRSMNEGPTDRSSRRSPLPSQGVRGHWRGNAVMQELSLMCFHYDRFLQTCRLRGFTFTFTVRIIVQFLYQDDSCGTNPLFQFLYYTWPAGTKTEK
jgi:hypothetical protein